MTEIEKLAEESWKSRDDWSNASDKAHIQGFRAGFRKAREMAKTEALIDLMESRKYPAGKSFVDIIEQLGEKEI